MLINKNIKYYLQLALKKPYLIKRFLYTKHEGLILSMDILGNNFIENEEIIYRMSTNIDVIHQFYNKMRRSSMTTDTIKDLISNNNECILIHKENLVIGAMWIIKERFSLNTISSKVLSSQKEIILNNEALYGAYVIIDENFRGQKLNQNLLRFALNYYAKNSEYKKLFVITGTNNGAYIKSSMIQNAKLVGIVKVVNIIGFIKRKELYIDKSGVLWK